MPRKIVDLTGQKFGRLTAIKDSGKRSASNGVMWLCKCACGEIRVVQSGNLRSGNVKSCGCYRADRLIKHGHSMRSSTYSSWSSMLTRCSNKNQRSYRYYGAKGISVCERWKDYSAFLEDMGEKPVDGWHIDRIDPNGNYEPGNCEWVSASENSKRMVRYYKGLSV